MAEVFCSGCPTLTPPSPHHQDTGPLGHSSGSPSSVCVGAATLILGSSMVYLTQTMV